MISFFCQNKHQPSPSNALDLDADGSILYGTSINNGNELSPWLTKDEFLQKYRMGAPFYNLVSIFER